MTQEERLARINEIKQLIADKKAQLLQNRDQYKNEPQSEYYMRLAKNISAVNPEKAKDFYDLAYKAQYSEANINKANRSTNGISSGTIATQQRQAFKGVNNPTSYMAVLTNLKAIDPNLVRGVPDSWENGGADFVKNLQEAQTKRDVDLKTIMQNATSIMQNVKDQSTYGMARNMLAKKFNLSEEDLTSMGLPIGYSPSNVQNIQTGGIDKSLAYDTSKVVSKADIAKANADIEDYTQDLTPKQASAFDAIVKDVTGDTRVKAALDAMESARALVNSVGDAQTLSGLDAVTATYRFLKSIDPGSVVREAEVKMFADAAGAISTMAQKMVNAGQAPDMMSALNQLTITTIGQKAIADMKKLAEGMFNNAKKVYETYIKMGDMRGNAYGLGDKVSRSLKSLATPLRNSQEL